MSHRLIIAEIQCNCNKYVNVRLKEVNKGDSHTVSCWNCGREIKLQNQQGYVDGKKAKRTTIVMNEVVKDE